MNKLGPEKLVELFTNLLKVRLIEERMIEMSTGGMIPGWMHSGIGQEAIGVGVVAHLSKDDYVSNTHRGRARKSPRGPT